MTTGWIGGLLRRVACPLAVCFALLLALGVPDRAFAQSQFYLECPTTTVTEGNSVTVNLVREGSNTGSTYFSVFHTDTGTAGTSDYVAIDNVRHLFNITGTTSRGGVSVSTSEDTEWENDETFTVRFTPTTSLKPGQSASCTLTISDDDGPTHSASSGALVSNLAQKSHLDARLVFSNDSAQAFTTGSNAHGYLVTGVEFALRRGTGTPSYQVEIHTTASTDSLVGTLTAPALTAGDQTVRATTSAPIHLAAGTTYRAVVDTVAPGDNTSVFVGTNSDSEDGGAAAGWSIADNGLSRFSSNQTWESRTGASMKVAIIGTAVPATATVPGAPAAPRTRVASATSVLVAWEAPANDGNTTILDYDVRYYAGSADPSDPADWIEEGETGGHAHAGTEKTATITGLSRDTAYRVQVRAQNGVGEGAWSASVPVAIVPPEEPAAPEVTAGSATSLRMAWRAPGIGGSNLPIADYDVRWKKPGQDDTQWTEADDTSASTATNTTVTGLEAGETYEVQVRAQNLVGDGAWSASARAQTHASQRLGGGTLLSNLGVSGSSANLKDKDYRVTFRTGSNPGGYMLTGVVVGYSGLSAADADAVFHSITVTGGEEAIELAPASNPLVDGNNTWRVNRGSGDLEPDTAYQVVLNVISQDLGLDGTVALTTSTSLEAGAADGWSITGSEARNWDATAWSASTDRLKFAVTGIRKGAVRPKINLVRVASAPTHDADGDGANDTYVRGDEILIDVEFRSGEAVQVDTGGDNANVALRVELGGATKKFPFDRALHGDETLRFAYTVDGGNDEACSSASTTADCDADGITPAPGTVDGVADTLVELSGGATAMSADSFVAADLRHAGGFFRGVPARLKVDGGVRAEDSTAGPRATAAEIPAGSRGRTLTVTFDEPLGPFDQGWVQRNLSIKASNVHTRKTQYQHPTRVARSTKTEGGATRGVLTLTLGVPVRAADRVYLGYGYVTDDGGRVYRELKGTDGRLTPDFANFPVVNNLPGAPPIPVRAEIAGSALMIAFDKALDPAALPAGQAFTVHWSDRDDDRGAFPGTGSAGVEGSLVVVSLQRATGPDALLSVDYDPAGQAAASRLKGAGADGGLVNAIEGFEVRQVRDVTAPELLNALANILQTRTNDPLKQGKSRIMLYFDEPLDRTSVPAAGDFALSSTDSGAVSGAAVASVSVEDTAVNLTTTHWLKDNVSYTLEHTPGTHPIRDLAGNAVAAFENMTVRSFAVGQPVLRGSTVDGSRLELNMRTPLNPGAVPPPSAFTLWEKDIEDGETERHKLSNRVLSVMVNSSQAVLQLAHPVYPCAGETVFRVSYAPPESGSERFQTAAGWGAPGWTATHAHALVTNARHARCADWLAGTFRGSVILKSERPFARDRGEPDPAWFTVRASGGPVTVTGAAFSPDDPKVLKLTLSREFAAGETVMVSYRRPAGVSGLWDTAGNQLRDVVDAPVAVGPPALSVSDARAVEGEAVAFTVSLSAASDEAVTVDYATSDGTATATAGADYTAESGTLTLPAGATSATVLVYSTGDDAVEDDETFTLTLSDPSGAALDDAEAVGTIEDDDELAPLTAAFEGLPAEHNGKRLFGFEIVFSEEFDGLRLTAFAAGALEVTNGRLVDVQRVTRGENRRVAVRVRPSSSAEMTLRLPATTDCAAAGAICAADGRALSGPVSATVSGPGNAAATGAPAISGEARVGETLTATTDGIADADGLSGATFAFQWVKSADGADTDIAGATTASYTLGNADVGAAIRVRASFTDDAGNSEELTSAPTAPVAARPLTAEFSGAPESHDGQRLFHFELVFSENFPGRFPHTTLRDSAFTMTDGQVKGAERVVKGENRRWRIKVRPDSSEDVVITLPATTDCSAAGAVCTEAGRPLSNTTSVTVAGPAETSPATGEPTITGTARVGETLTADTSGISDADGLDNVAFSYQWLADDADISGATSATYTLADGDQGKAVRVRVSFTDDAGHDESLTSAATAAVAARPLTASFERMPAEHDGSKLFSFRLVFSENFPGRFPHTTLRDSAFEVTNGSVRAAERVVKGENRVWKISVRPSSNDDVVITLAAGSVSTESGRPLSNTVLATVDGPGGGS